MAEAALEAFGQCQQDKYLAAFRRARAWFHGQNSLRQALVDVRRGACCDGLHASDINRNQGAESTLAYLWTEVHGFEFQRALDAGAQGAVASESVSHVPESTPEE
jgi:hypothetical protein